MNSFSFTVRSIQLDLARQMESVEFIKDFTGFAAGNGYNSLTLYLEGRVRTPSFPYPASGESYGVEQMKEVVHHAGARGIDVIPVVSTLGHAEQFLKHPQLAHLSETRGGVGGRFGPGLNHVFCPSQKGTYEFFRNYLAEIGSLFPSPYFHVGCDETWDIACCDLCRERLLQGESQADIYAGHLIDIHRIVAGALGKRMIIWDDMFEFYPEALEKLPRDVIMACWQYHDQVDEARGHFFNRLAWDSLAKYDRLGFEYLICPSDYGRTIHNAESFTAYGAEHRPLGGLMTTWEKSDSFLLQSMPLLACVGRLWESGMVQSCDQILKSVVAGIFGANDDVFYLAIKAICGSGISQERRTALDDYLTRRENTADYSRSALVDMLLATLPPWLEKISGSSRPILNEILLSLRSEQISIRLDKLVPSFFYDQSAPGGGHAELREILTGLDSIAGERLALWRKIRPGIDSQKFEVVHRTLLKNLGDLPALARESGILTVHFLLPDQYSSQIVRLFIRYDEQPTYEKVAEGVFKEMRTFDCFYSRLFLISKTRTPVGLKIETSGFGGQGFTYFQIENERGRFLPSAVHTLRGTVTDSENLLTPDWTWTFAGERNTKKCFLDPELAAAVHGFEITMKNHE